MRYFNQLCAGINVSPIALALNRQPELWDAYKERKSFDGTAHTCVSDIWLRYNDRKNFDGDYVKFTQEHASVFYPAWHKLPQLRSIVYGLMAKVEATQLGGCLITRIPPGGHIRPHTDKGFHPEKYFTKIYIPIVTNQQCFNRVMDETVIMSTGDAWFFDNTVEHEVINDGSTERITLILSMCTELDEERFYKNHV